MPVMERLQREQRFHDAQAAERAATFAVQPNRLQFTDEEYLDHAPWVRYAVDQLGDVRRQHVLDWGCGHGMAAVMFARRGASVMACDLSAGYVRETRTRSMANGVDVECVQADAHRTPFANRTFDAVWGHAILHHLDVPSAALELRRILKPKGVVVLCEPWGGNPLMRLARKWLPRTVQTEDEDPLSHQQVNELRKAFDSVSAQPFFLVRGLPITRYVVLTLRP